MPALVGIIVSAVISVIAVITFSIWGLPFVLITVGLIVMYVAGSRNRDDSVVEVERNARRKPTGIPRSASGGADTANERVGQA